MKDQELRERMVKNSEVMINFLTEFVTKNNILYDKLYALMDYLKLEFEDVKPGIVVSKKQPRGLKS